MAETTKIQWCDHTASPWHGCSKTDNPGCDNCYAAAMAPRNPGILGVWGDDGVRVKSKSFADKMQQWQRKAEKTGQDVTVFPSLCDPFEDRPELAPWRQEMFGLADECPNVTLLLLTKRPENIRRMWVERDDLLECSACLWRGSEAESQQVDFEDEPAGWECPQCQSPCGHKPIDEPTFRPNVWLLTSVSDQTTADRNIPELLKCRDLSPVLGVSYEPALGPVDFLQWMRPKPDCGFVEVDGCCFHPDSITPECHAAIACPVTPTWQGLNWLIVGGESGPNARPCNVQWIRSAVQQCEAAGVACFIKQLGANATDSIHGRQSPASIATWIGRVNHPKGGDPSEWLEDLRVRQFPST